MIYKLASSIRVSARVPSSANFIKIRASFAFFGIFSQPFYFIYSGERIVQMVFIRFQYPLQRHFVVLVVAGLVVDITIMQAPIAIHRFMFIPMVLQDLSVGLL